MNPLRADNVYKPDYYIYGSVSNFIDLGVMIELEYYENKIVDFARQKLY